MTLSIIWGREGGKGEGTQQGSGNGFIIAAPPRQPSAMDGGCSTLHSLSVREWPITLISPLTRDVARRSGVGARKPSRMPSWSARRSGGRSIGYWICIRPSAAAVLLVTHGSSLRTTTGYGGQGGRRRSGFCGRGFALLSSTTSGWRDPLGSGFRIGGPGTSRGQLSVEQQLTFNGPSRGIGLVPG